MAVRTLGTLRTYDIKLRTPLARSLCRRKTPVRDVGLSMRCDPSPRGVAAGVRRVPGGPFPRLWGDGPSRAAREYPMVLGKAGPGRDPSGRPGPPAAHRSSSIAWLSCGILMDIIY